MTRDIADSVGLKDAHGALVTESADGSPGAKAGLKSGDVITAVDGEAIDNALALSPHHCRQGSGHRRSS